MTRMFLALPLLLLVAPPARADDLNAQLAHCLTMNGAVERLSCYDRVARDAMRAPQVSRPAPAIATPQAAQPRGFGQEQLPKSSAEQEERVTAEVADFRLDGRSRFTVTLKNGQVWQQMAGDTNIAHYDPRSSQPVSISRGSFGSYDLKFNDRNITFKVKRLR
jgi:hypothetical protein